MGLGEVGDGAKEEPVREKVNRCEQLLQLISTHKSKPSGIQLQVFLRILPHGK